jgi:hypothetical protein
MMDFRRLGPGLKDKKSLGPEVTIAMSAKGQLCLVNCAWMMRLPRTAAF